MAAVAAAGREASGAGAFLCYGGKEERARGGAGASGHTCAKVSSVRLNLKWNCQQHGSARLPCAPAAAAAAASRPRRRFDHAAPSVREEPQGGGRCHSPLHRRPRKHGMLFFIRDEACESRFAVRTWYIACSSAKVRPSWIIRSRSTLSLSVCSEIDGPRAVNEVINYIWDSATRSKCTVLEWPT